MSKAVPSSWCEMNVLYCFLIIGCFLVFGDRNELSCTTPNGETAQCVSIRSCPIFKEALFSDDPSLQKFTDASLSACGYRCWSICCGTFAKYTNVFNKDESRNNSAKENQSSIKSKKEYAIEKLVPSTKYCGMQHRDDYISNDTAISVDEFPWLVVVYSDHYYGGSTCLRDVRAENICFILPPPGGPLDAYPRITDKCSGVLISNRYVLTASNCYSPISIQVALGQYDQHKSIGCSPTPYGFDDCTHPIVNLTVTEQILSPNDSLLLLRLEAKVEYTDFVRPICLPMNETIRPKINDSVATSGWGYRWIDVDVDDENATVVKKRIMHTITSNDICKEDPSSPNHLCTTINLDSENQTTSSLVRKSDRGGPIMYRYKTRNWYVEGLVAVNGEICVNETAHSIRLTPALVDWILENMKD